MRVPRLGPRLDTVCCSCGGSRSVTKNTLRKSIQKFKNPKNCSKVAFLWFALFLQKAMPMKNAAFWQSCLPLPANHRPP